MSAFALQPTGPPVPCDFRGCMLDAWHEGEHEFPRPANAIQWTYDRHCVVCGVAFTILGADKALSCYTCGSEPCLLHYARRFASTVPLACCCPQRPYAHELSVHAEIRSEWWKAELRTKWPWSLMLSRREEPSTERKAT